MSENTQETNNRDLAAAEIQEVLKKYNLTMQQHIVLVENPTETN